MEPLDTRGRLTLRIREATEEDHLIGLVFTSALTYLEKKLGREPLEKIRKEEKVPESIVPIFRYPVTSLLKVLHRALAQHKATEDDATFMEGLGRDSVATGMDSLIGKTITALAKGNPQSLLSSAAAGGSTATNFGKRQHEKTGERSAILRYQGDLMGPAYVTGILKGVLEDVCKTKATISASQMSPSGSDYVLEVRW